MGLLWSHSVHSNLTSFTVLSSYPKTQITCSTLFYIFEKQIREYKKVKWKTINRSPHIICYLVVFIRYLNAHWHSRDFCRVAFIVKILFYLCLWHLKSQVSTERIFCFHLKLILSSLKLVFGLPVKGIWSGSCFFFFFIDFSSSFFCLWFKNIKNMFYIFI